MVVGVVVLLAEHHEARLAKRRNHGLRRDEAVRLRLPDTPGQRMAARVLRDPGRRRCPWGFCALRGGGPQQADRENQDTGHAARHPD